MQHLFPHNKAPSSAASPPDPMQQPLTKIPVPLPAIVLLLFAIDCCYQLGVRHGAPADALIMAAFDATLYTGVIWVSIRLDLAKTTAVFLAIPYLIFLPGWLNLPTAALSLTIFLYCIKQSLATMSATRHDYISASDLAAFVFIAVLVNTSGAGGFGFQWDDYNMHNARLKDLVEMPWPVRYGENQNFVYYFGYFLPAALVGKITTLDTAFRSMYVWTLLGTTLSLRWLAHLGQWKFSPLLILVFIIFGPYDILNVLITSGGIDDNLKNWFIALVMYSDRVNFNLSYEFSFFIGNYLSNAYNLYWSPQQVIAGWLATGLLVHLYLEGKFKVFIFIYALLCLWAPLVMIALLPLVIMATVRQSTINIREIFTVENLLGATSLSAIFVVFYLGGSAGANPSFWIFDRLTSLREWLLFFLLCISGWGIYALAISPFITTQHPSIRHLFFCLIFSLAILPLRTFGEWGDLLCRGSTALMFLLLILFLRAMQHYWRTGRKNVAALLCCLLLPGSISSAIINLSSIANYGRTQPVASIISYPNAYPNLGPDNTAFARWFRRHVPNGN